jgi:PIN domain nuclease of toxin-antitoxin system
MHFFFDSYALIELIKNNPTYEKFRDELIVTNALNIAETHYILMTIVGREKADAALQRLSVTLLALDKEIAIAASTFRHQQAKLKLSYANCIGYCLARKHHLLFLTGDDALKKFDSVEFVK